jgi:hypothetical protein
VFGAKAGDELVSDLDNRANLIPEGFEGGASGLVEDAGEAVQLDEETAAGIDEDLVHGEGAMGGDGAGRGGGIAAARRRFKGAAAVGQSDDAEELVHGPFDLDGTHLPSLLAEETGKGTEAVGIPDVGGNDPGLAGDVEGKLLNPQRVGMVQKCRGFDGGDQPGLLGLAACRRESVGDVAGLVSVVKGEEAIGLRAGRGVVVGDK